MVIYNPATRRTASGRLKEVVRSGCYLSMTVAFLTLTQFASSMAEENHQENASQNREEARIRAESQLGYPYVFRDSRDRHVDFFSLAAQISALSQLINQMSVVSPSARITSPPNVPLAAGLARSTPSAMTREAHGPDGPSLKSVRLIAEYQLLKNGKKRLKLGEVIDHGDALTVDIVTQDGSLVERYRIDKKTGNWLPVEDP